MAHAVLDEHELHMGVPVPNGKLAMWIFLATEIMFFTGLIGTYLVLRNGQPRSQWPTPEQVHLVEWIGALNTFVLICSSLTVVLAHWAIGRGQIRQAVQYVAVTLILGGVFLGIKAYEYNAKFQHGILPGHVFDRLDGPAGAEYLRKIRGEVKELVEKGHGEGSSDLAQLQADLEIRDGRAAASPGKVAEDVHAL